MDDVDDERAQTAIDVRERVGGVRQCANSDGSGKRNGRKLRPRNLDWDDEREREPKR